MTAIKYLSFAIISTFLNISFQYFSFLLYSGFAALYIAMFIGILTGLISKYILDKKYIFHDAIKNNSNNNNHFFRYTLTGGITTIIFCGTEIGFNAVFHTEYAKYIGAIIGLSIGYTIKYFLDKKYVFIEETT